MSRYSSRFDVALSFAAEMHAGQTRKATAIPYIIHPVQVAWLLREYRWDESTIVAGLLHDVLEDTDCDLAQLQELFGHTVAAIVLEVTEPDKSLEWERRKSDALTCMRTMTPKARAVTCADKAHNLHTIADALQRGENVFSRFKRGRQAQLEHHRHILAALSAGFDDAILDELRLALGRVEEL